MVKGGYKIIDLKDKNLVTASQATIAGIYDRIENAYRKPLLLSGIHVNGVEYGDCYICPTLSGSDFKFTAWGFTFTVNNNDQVSFTEN